jgi:hypothetical protein
MLLEEKQDWLVEIRLALGRNMDSCELASRTRSSSAIAKLKLKYMI